MRIVFMGTPESAVPSLERLVDDGHQVAAVWTQPDKPAGRGRKLHSPPVSEIARQHGLPVYQLQKIKTAEAKDLFASHHADVAVVVAYGKILPPEFLAAPKHGCVNVHFSLLPKYRGAAPVNWAMVNGESQTGVTTMRIVQELDAGPILLQKAVEIVKHETAPELLTRLADLGADLLSETLGNFDRLDPKAQLDANATFAPVLKRQDGLIDWTLEASSIERRVRGFQPWPNAFTNLSSQRLIIWRAEAELCEHAKMPGTIVDARSGLLTIACGDGTVLRISELQAEGSRRMKTRDFLNGRELNVGDLVG
jgi:methionyl-tRNA formyltransferase